MVRQVNYGLVGVASLDDYKSTITQLIGRIHQH